MRKRELDPFVIKRKVLLMRAGLTYTELAKPLGVAYQAVGNVITNRMRSAAIEEGIVTAINKSMATRKKGWKNVKVDELFPPGSITRFVVSPQKQRRRSA